MKTLILAATASLVVASFVLPASASQIAAGITSPDQSSIVYSGGCGRWGWRDRWGHCRRR